MDREATLKKQNGALYKQIKERLEQEIRDRRWKPGESIPTEPELMELYQVSRTTIRQAVSLLEQEGLLERHQGRGTFVCRPKMLESLANLRGFAEEVARKGYNQSSIVLFWLKKQTLFFENGKLNLDKNDRILLVERIRFMDEVPVAVERTCWPEDIGAVFQKYDLNVINFYEILEKNGIYLKKSREIIGAVNASIYEAELLGVEYGMALLEMSRTTTDVNGRVIEYARTRYRSDYYNYEIELNR